MLTHRTETEDQIQLRIDSPLRASPNKLHVGFIEFGNAFFTISELKLTINKDDRSRFGIQLLGYCTAPSVYDTDLTEKCPKDMTAEAFQDNVIVQMISHHPDVKLATFTKTKVASKVAQLTRLDTEGIRIGIGPRYEAALGDYAATTIGVESGYHLERAHQATAQQRDFSVAPRSVEDKGISWSFELKNVYHPDGTPRTYDAKSIAKSLFVPSLWFGPSLYKAPSIASETLAFCQSADFSVISCAKSEFKLSISLTQSVVGFTHFKHSGIRRLVCKCYNMTPLAMASQWEIPLDGIYTIRNRYHTSVQLNVNIGQDTETFHVVPNSLLTESFIVEDLTDFGISRESYLNSNLCRFPNSFLSLSQVENRVRNLRELFLRHNIIVESARKKNSQIDIYIETELPISLEVTTELIDVISFAVGQLGVKDIRLETRDEDTIITIYVASQLKAKALVQLFTHVKQEADEEEPLPGTISMVSRNCKRN